MFFILTTNRPGVLGPDMGFGERGKFDELMTLKGFFYDLYMSQFRRQEEVAQKLPTSDIPGGNGHMVAEPVKA